MDMDMDIDLAPAVAGRKRSAASEDAAGLEKDWRREEEVRGKVPKWNSREDESREDISPEIRELLHKGYILILQSAASRAASTRRMEEFARLAPKAFALKTFGRK